ISFSCGYSWLFAATCFTRLRQLNRLYPVNLTRNRATWLSINKFIRMQTSTLVSIFSFNAIFGNLFLTFIIINWPLNTYFVHMLPQDRVPLVMKSFFVMLIQFQSFYIFVFHLIAAMYYK